MNKLIVISGCSGGGKSTLLTELRNNGFSVVPEIGREIVKEQLEINGDTTPWQNPKRFCEELIKKSVIAYHQAKAIQIAKDQVIFFDRSFLEGINYYQNLKIAYKNKFDHLIHELRYYSTILMTPPWKEIYFQDIERKHSFDEAEIEYNQLLKFYPICGYQIIEVPKISVKERYQYILSIIK